MQSGDKHGKAMHFKQFESMLTFRMSVLQHTFSKQLTLSKMYVVTYEPSHVELFKMHCFTMFITNLCLNFLMKFVYDHEKMTMNPIYLSTANNLIGIPLTETSVVQLAVSPEGFATV